MSDVHPLHPGVDMGLSAAVFGARRFLRGVLAVTVVAAVVGAGCGGCRAGC